MNSACCGLTCQHPGCWNSFRVEIINAQKNAYAGLFDDGRRHDCYIQVHNTRKEKEIEDESVVSQSSDSLPTLKIINLFANDSDSDDSRENQYGGYISLQQPNRELSFPISSTGTRDFGRVSKMPKAPCASPSPSFTSIYLRKLQQRSRQQWNQRDVQSKSEAPNALHATYVHVQPDEGSDSDDKIVMPYLIWVPSKKSKKRKKQKSADEGSSQTPKIVMKNINEDNLDFGQPGERYNQDTALRSFSRASQTVRSSPTRLYPRRLPPIPNASPERRSSQKSHLKAQSKGSMQFDRNGLFTCGRALSKTGPLTPVTPKNTRASLRIQSGKPEKSSKKDVRESSSLKDEENAEVIKEENDLTIEPEDMFVIQNGMQLSVQKPDLQVTNSCVEMHMGKREEMVLPRVTVPRNQLKRLKIEQHCKNSIPSHQLQNIQMQPIAGIAETVSRVSTASLMDKTNTELDEELKNGQNSLLVEAPISDKGIEKLLDSALFKQREHLMGSERLMFHWEFDEETCHAPAPTPASPSRRALEPSKLDDNQVIKASNRTNSKLEEGQLTLKKKEQFLSGAAADDVKVETKSISPVPSKASSNDWPSDKDIMKQTYEQYRSFTPFKTPGVSLTDARIKKIVKVKNNQKRIENNASSDNLHPKVILNATFQLSPYVFSSSLGQQYKHVMYMRPRLSAVFGALKQSLSTQRKIYRENVSELSVSHLDPNRRRKKDVFSNFRVKTNTAPLLVDKMKLVDPKTKPKHDYVPSYEIYESNLELKKNPDLDSDEVHIVIPVPNSSPCDLIEDISDENLAQDRFGENFETIDENRQLELTIGETDHQTQKIDKSDGDASVKMDSGGGIVESIERENAVEDDGSEEEICCESETMSKNGELGDSSREQEILIQSSNQNNQIAIIGNDSSDTIAETATSKLASNADTATESLPNSASSHSKEFVLPPRSPVVSQLSEYPDLDSESLPDLCFGVNFSLNLAEEMNEAMLNLNDFDDHSGEEHR